MQNISSSTFSIPQQQQQQQPTILKEHNKLKVDRAKKLPRKAKTKQAK